MAIRTTRSLSRLSLVALRDPARQRRPQDGKCAIPATSRCRCRAGWGAKRPG